MTLQIGGSCHYHPMRAGIGVCVECRQVICPECATQFDGINRCAACLAKMSRAAAGKVPRSDYRPGSLLAGALIFGALFGAVFGLCSLLAL